MKYFRLSLFYLLIWSIFLFGCQTQKCSISQTSSSNCRAVATICAVELYLKNNVCALLKRLDILMDDPKSTLEHAVNTMEFLSEYYDEEKANKIKLPKINIISPEQKHTNELTNKGFTLKKDRNKSQISNSKNILLNRLKKKEKTQMNIKEYSLNIIRNYINGIFSYPLKMKLYNLVQTLHQNLKELSKILLSFFDKFLVSNNADYEAIISNIFKLKFDNLNNNPHIYDCQSNYCIIGLDWKIIEAKNILKETKKYEQNVNVKVRGRLFSLMKKLKKVEPIKNINKYNEEKSKIKKFVGEHAIYSIPMSSKTSEYIIEGRDQRFKDHPKLFFIEQHNEYVTDTSLSEGEWHLDKEKGQYFIKIGTIRNIYILKDLI